MNWHAIQLCLYHNGFYWQNEHTHPIKSSQRICHNIINILHYISFSPNVVIMNTIMFKSWETLLIYPLCSLTACRTPREAKHSEYSQLFERVLKSRPLINSFCWLGCNSGHWEAFSSLTSLCCISFHTNVDWRRICCIDGDPLKCIKLISNCIA